MTTGHYDPRPYQVNIAKTTKTSSSAFRKTDGETSNIPGNIPSGKQQSTLSPESLSTEVNTAEC